MLKLHPDGLTFPDILCELSNACQEQQVQCVALKCIHKSIYVDSQIYRIFWKARVVDECLCCICHAMSAAYTGSSANLHTTIIFAGICSTEARLPLHKSFWRQVEPSCLQNPQMGFGGCGQHCCRLCRGPGFSSRCPAGSSCSQESRPPPTGTSLCRSAWCASLKCCKAA